MELTLTVQEVFYFIIGIGAVSALFYRVSAIAKEVTSLKLEVKDLSKEGRESYEELSRRLQDNYKELSRELQSNYKELSRELQSNYKELSRELQSNYKELSRKLENNYNELSKELYSLKEIVTGLNTKLSTLDTRLNHLEKRGDESSFFMGIRREIVSPKKGEAEKSKTSVAPVKRLEK